MSHQEMEMQFAEPDWQPESSRQSLSPSQESLSILVESKNTSSQRQQTDQTSSVGRRGGTLLGLFARIALVVVWLTTPLVGRAFHGGWILPLLGLFFLPMTALTYTVVFALAGSVSGLGWLWIAGAVLLDLASYGGQMSKRKKGHPQDED